MLRLTKTVPRLRRDWLLTLWTMIVVLGTDLSAGAQEPAVPTVDAAATILLQSDAPGVLVHSLSPEGLVTSVTFRSTVLKAGEQTVRFRSVEPGRIRNVGFSSGRLVRPDTTQQWLKLKQGSTFQRDLPAFESECRASLSFAVDPGRPDRQYEAALAAIKLEVAKSKDLPSDPVARERTENRLIREHCVATIKSLRPGGADRRSLRMGPTRLFDSPSDPVSALRDAYRWWHFEDLLRKVDERPDDSWADVRKLAFGQEIMDLLSGTIAEDQTKSLTAAQRKRLIDGCRFEITFEFEPLPSEKQPDRRWKQAYRIQMGADGPDQVHWTTNFRGSGHPRSEWLDLGIVDDDARPTLRLHGESNSISTMWVHGPDKRQFLRVVPQSKESRGPVRFELTGDSTDRLIEIPEQTRAAPRFPF